MILNPPNIVRLLRLWKLHCEIHARTERNLGLMDYQKHFINHHSVRCLAGYFGMYLSPMEWDAFKRTYQLYLQSIPFATAREAWGLMNAGNQQPNKP